MAGLALLVAAVVGGTWLAGQRRPPEQVAAPRATDTLPPASPAPSGTVRPAGLATVTTDPGTIVLVRPTAGSGPGTVSTFTAPDGFLVLFSCLGPGGMSAWVDPVGTATRPRCDGTVQGDSFASGAPGPVTLRIAADRQTLWSVAVEARPPAPPPN